MKEYFLPKKSISLSEHSMTLFVLLFETFCYSELLAHFSLFPKKDLSFDKSFTSVLLQKRNETAGLWRPTSQLISLSFLCFLCKNSSSSSLSNTSESDFSSGVWDVVL